MVINNQAEQLEYVHEVSQQIVRADGTMENSLSDCVVTEHFMELYVNDWLVARLVCTPTQLDCMVLGRLITEGFCSMQTITQDIESIYICEHGSRAKVYLCENERTNQFMQHLSQNPHEIVTEPTCCTNNQMMLELQESDFLKNLPVQNWKKEWIFAMANAFAKGSGIHKSTKGTHSCYLGVQGNVVYAAEDLGRHNAMDKCIGYVAKNHINPKECMLFTTGRVPTDMVKKAVASGIPVLVSKAVPTDRAIAMAKKYGLNLICKAWPDQFVIYNDARTLENE